MFIVLKKRYESEIESLREIQTRQERQLKEQNTMLLEKCSEDLRRQFEAMSEARLSEYAAEKTRMEQEVTAMKASMDELRRQLDAETEKSSEKNAELITLNKQKFKLMAQVKNLKSEIYIKKID